MAKKTQYVWGLELGQCALKALRCRLEGDQVVADSYDYIEYPKILSQPDAEPEALVADALQQFLSRNDLRGAKVGMSVPGQSGLSKFFKPPPVEVKKIGDIVRYEARQQIPFDLADVIWDYQQMAGSQVEDGYALESEVGLFAMKREAVVRVLKPFQTAGIEVDLIQLAPISLYNMLAFDRFQERLASDTYDPDHPPASDVLLSFGADSSDLIVTNGFRVWQRSMPIGGNHLTRQLTKELKLTFAKAEHLKRNAMQSDDPKLVFQAMRPIFNDLVTDIQRSIGFFKSLNKKSEIGRILLAGNSVKLPGLQPYLNKNLGFEVEGLDRFKTLTGSEVVGAPSFKENQLAFGVVYGLCLQLLGRGPIRTNLLPKEILTERLVRSKKPWAVAGLSALLLGFTVNFGLIQSIAANVKDTKWSSAESAAEQTNNTSKNYQSEDSTQLATVQLLQQIGLEVGGNNQRRLLWMELLAGLQPGLNRNPDFFDPETGAYVPPDPSVLPYTKRGDFHVKRIESRYYTDVQKWLSDRRLKLYEQETEARLVGLGRARPKRAAAADADGDDSPLGGTGAADEPELTVEGPGWVIEIDAYHFHNGQPGKERKQWVRQNLIQFLEEGEVELPGPDGRPMKFTTKELGVSYPMIVDESYNRDFAIPNPRYAELLAKQAGGRGGVGGAGGLGGPGGMGGLGGGGLGGGGLGGGGLLDGGTGGGRPGGAGQGRPGSRRPGAGGRPGGGRGGSLLGGGGAGMDMGDEGMMGGGLMGGGLMGGGLMGGGGRGAGRPDLKDEDGNVVPPTFEAPRYDFSVQFIWQETPLTVRLEARREAEEKAKQQQDSFAADDSLASTR